MQNRIGAFAMAASIGKRRRASLTSILLRLMDPVARKSRQTLERDASVVLEAGHGLVIEATLSDARVMLRERVML